MNANFNIVGPSSRKKRDSWSSTSHGISQEAPLKRQFGKHSSIRGKGGDPHKGSSSFSLDSYKGKNNKKGQTPLPQHL